MHTFEQLYRPAADADAALHPMLEQLHGHLTRKPINLPSVKSAIVGVLEFLASPRGRTDANCRVVDFFLMQDEAWDDDEFPEAYIDILADMSGALHDTVSAPNIAADFESTPEQLLGRVRVL